MSKDSSHSVSTPTWDGPVQRASHIVTDVCECGDLIGIDLMAKDSKVFAHAHMELEQAEAFHKEFERGLKKLRKNLRRRVN